MTPSLHLDFAAAERRQRVAARNSRWRVWLARARAPQAFIPSAARDLLFAAIFVGAVLFLSWAIVAMNP